MIEVLTQDFERENSNLISTSTVDQMFQMISGFKLDQYCVTVSLICIALTQS